MSEQIKPPVGLKPKHIHDHNRALEIIAAIKRYNEAQVSIPDEWLIELNNLYKALKKTLQ